MTDRELMQVALDALEWCYDVTEWPANGNSPQDKAIEALRARLAQPEPEPVAWISAEETWLVPKLVISDTPKDGYKPVYTAPPQRECVSCAGLCCQDYEKCNLPCTPRGREQARREWQGLTDEEVFAALVAVDGNTKRLAPGFVAFYCAIEAALKAKNG